MYIGKGTGRDRGNSSGKGTGKDKSWRRSWVFTLRGRGVDRALWLEPPPPFPEKELDSTPKTTLAAWDRGAGGARRAGGGVAAQEWGRGPSQGAKRGSR